MNLNQSKLQKLLQTLDKEATVPATPPMDPAMMGGAPPMPPMDPAMMGGAPPMDPAMMGGAPPMDPAMMDPAMGGAPPMDPAMMDPAMGAPPMPPMDPAMMDPAMGGAPPMPPAEGGVPIQMSQEDLKALIDSMLQERSESDKSKRISNKILLDTFEQRMDTIEQRLEDIAKHFNIASTVGPMSSRTLNSTVDDVEDSVEEDPGTNDGFSPEVTGENDANMSNQDKWKAALEKENGELAKKIRMLRSVK